MKIKIGPYRKNRAYHIHIDDWDVWSLDHTLATIIHPALIRLSKIKHGHPDHDRYSDECYSEYDAQESFEEILNREEEYEELWNTRLDKMIYAFGMIIGDDCYNWSKEENEKINEGLHLFSEHYFSLWD